MHYCILPPVLPRFLLSFLHSLHYNAHTLSVPRRTGVDDDEDVFFLYSLFSPFLFLSPPKRLLKLLRNGQMILHEKLLKRNLEFARAANKMSLANETHQPDWKLVRVQLRSFE